MILNVISKALIKSAIAREITLVQAIQCLQYMNANPPLLSNESRCHTAKGSRKEKIMARDKSCKCFYCGIDTVHRDTNELPDTMTIDHILPKSRGGINHIDNCIIACEKCNNEKASSLLPDSILRW